jgi:uracil-DNA glycosylase family 4
VERSDDLRGELRSLVGAMKNHVANGRDSFNPVSRLTMKGEPIDRREEQMQGNLMEAPPKAAAGARRTSLTLAGVREDLGECTRCPLHSTRKNLVFGEGSARARLVFVGEAPGEEEDNQGRPFVGRAGQLLTKIISAMGLTREEVYICNILKCRPPGNRNPKEVEITTCEPFLVKQLEAINPEIICALGTFAAKTLLRTESPISAIRGKFHDYHGRKLMPTYHPAYLLRNPDAKKLVWEDVQKIMKIL